MANIYIDVNELPVRLHDIAGWLRAPHSQPRFERGEHLLGGVLARRAARR